jgi:hypothetical protein
LILYQEIRKATPDTIEELKNEGYFVFHDTEETEIMFEAQVKGMKTKQVEDFRMNLFKNMKSDKRILNKEAFTFIRYPGTNKKSMIFKNHYIENHLKFSKDNFHSGFIGIAFHKNSVFFQMFKTEIQKLFESGIIQNDELTFGLKRFNEIFKVHEESKNIVPLSLQMLQGGFVIWLIAVFISIMTFVAEIIFNKILNFRKIENANQIIVI